MSDLKLKLIDKILERMENTEEMAERLRIDVYQLIEEEAMRRLQSMTDDELLELA